MHLSSMNLIELEHCMDISPKISRAVNQAKGRSEPR
nr:MAG TPA: hypothetical protein [Bacteriophage sp.]